MGVIGNTVSFIKDKTVKACAFLADKLIPDSVYNNKVDKNWDGKFLPNCNNCDKPDNIATSCNADIYKGSETEPSTGKKPGKGCDRNPMPKVYFINGINNTPQENCSATKAIAKATCSEVIGVYNRTQGMITDLFECLGNIFNIHPFGGDIPTNKIKDILVNSINSNEPVTILAHSQGGLITREAINEAKKQLSEESLMSDSEIEALMGENTNIISLGTAEYNWPKGPNYEQFTHPKDIVPKIISGADSLTMPSPLIGDMPNPNYMEEMEAYNSLMANIPSEKKHVVDTRDKNGKEFGLGTDAHNMEISYAPALAKQRKNDNGYKCEICPNK